ncbi:hypothetical protein DICPUDRAFT_19018, partial [Dictyostelium purpureum]
VWNNVYIRSIIFDHLKIYHFVHEYTSKEYNMFCLKTLKLFKYKSYITELNYHSESFQFNFEDNEINEDLFYTDLTLISNNGDQDMKLPSSIERLTIHSNEDLSNGFIPDSVRSLCFTTEFNQEIQSGDIPINVTLVSIETLNYTKQIKPGVLPMSVVSLSFGSNTFTNSIMEEQEEKSSDNKEDCSQVLVKGSIPDSVVYLNMGNFDQPLTENLIPDSVEELEFYSFNSEIKSLPSSIKRLVFNRGFNQDLSILPPTIEHLDLGSDFNTEISNT